MMGAPKWRRRARSGAALGVVCLALAPGGASALSLSEAFAVAYETNPTLISARANLRAIDEQVAQARAGLRPGVSAVLDYGVDRTLTGRAGGDANETDDPFSASLQATQPLYDGGETYNLVLARIADVSAARARLEDLEQETLLDVVVAYSDILRDQEVLELARNNVRVLTEQLRAARDRFEVGEVTRTDVSQAEARLAEARANLASAEGQLQRSIQTFLAVVGGDPLNLAPLPDLPPLPETMEEAVAIALSNHPLMLAARFDETSASREVRAAIGTLLPDLDLQGSLGYSEGGIFDDDPSFDESRQASLGARLTIPLYQGGFNYSRVRQAQASASQSRAQITAEARERERVARAAYTELLVAQANIQAVREQVEAAQLAFEGVREEAIVGSRTILDVLDAEQELLDARTDLVASQRDEYVAGFALLSAIGALSMADLEIATVAYDPDFNYDLNNERWFGYERTADTEWETLWRP